MRLSSKSVGPILEERPFSISYAILNIAAVASAAGNVIVNVPEVEVLTAPKSRTATAALVVNPDTVELL